MSFTLIGKHEKDSRANRDGYVTAMEDLMKADRNVVHIDCDLYNCINTAKLEKEFPGQCFNAGIAEAEQLAVVILALSNGLAVEGAIDPDATVGIYEFALQRLLATA